MGFERCELGGMAHQVLERRGREAPNANGFFVQNDHGATVAGPFDSRFAAWAVADRLDAAASTELVGEIHAAEVTILHNNTTPIKLSR